MTTEAKMEPLRCVWETQVSISNNCVDLLMRAASPARVLRAGYILLFRGLRENGECF